MKKILIIPIILGSLFVVLLVGVFAIQWPSLVEKYSVRNINQAGEVDTSDWKTFDVGVQGLTFQYPANTVVTQEQISKGQDHFYSFVRINSPLHSFFIEIYDSGITNSPGLLYAMDAGVLYDGERILDSDTKLEAQSKIEKYYQNKINNSSLEIKMLSKNIFTSGNGSIFDIIENTNKSRKIIVILKDSNIIILGSIVDGQNFDSLIPILNTITINEN